MAITKQELQRFKELSEKARTVFIDNSDFQPEDWLEEEEKEEYKRLFPKWLDNLKEVK